MLRQRPTIIIITCAKISVVDEWLVVRFQKLMRLISLDVPEPGATGYQTLVRRNSKLTRSRATESTPRPKYHSRIAGSTSGAGRRARRPMQGSAFVDTNLDEERITWREVAGAIGTSLLTLRCGFRSWQWPVFRASLIGAVPSRSA